MKKFLILGNMNAITYKEVFPLIKDNQIWAGCKCFGGDRVFNVPDDYPLEAAGCGVDDNGKRFIRVKGVRWFTNLEHTKRHKPIDLYKRYTLVVYPKYDNYDAIEVSRTVNIPMDYTGVMGVPISFLDKYCPEQFEVLGCSAYSDAKYYGNPPLYVNGNKKYARFLIRHRDNLYKK